MEKSLNRLKELLFTDLEKLDNKITENNTPFLFLDLVRAIDIYTLFEYPDKEKFDNFIQFGYYKFLKQLYRHNTFNEIYFPFSKTSENLLSFCHYHLFLYGKYRGVERSIDLIKSGEAVIFENNTNNFTIHFPAEIGVEYIENKYFSNYLKLMRDFVLKDKIILLDQQEQHIHKQLSKEISVNKEHFIKYGSTPEIDEYYFRKGYILLMSSQITDDFDEKFTFGGIKYKFFLDVLQSVIGVALKHIDACLLLKDKNANIEIYNIISTPVVLDEIADQYASFLNIDKAQVKEILDVLTITETNIVAHKADDKEFSPPFIKVGKKFVLRSIKGCLQSSVCFLQSELKTRYPKDYFKWINEREGFFRKQLYDLFDSERIIRIERNIELNSNKIRTDIDAVFV